MNLERRGLLFGLGARELDYLAPLRAFVGDEPAELGRRARQRRAAKLQDARFDLGIGKAGGDLLVQLLDDVSRRAFGRADAGPGAGLEPRHGVADRRDIRQTIPARL